MDWGCRRSYRPSDEATKDTVKRPSGPPTRSRILVECLVVHLLMGNIIFCTVSDSLTGIIHACTSSNHLYWHNNGWTFQAHMRTHTGEKPYSCPWSGCHWRCNHHHLFLIVIIRGKIIIIVALSPSLSSCFSC